MPRPAPRLLARLAALPLLLAVALAGCGESDRDQVGRNIARASAAYATYIDVPAARGTLGVGTRPAAAVRQRAALAARYAVSELDAARAVATDDPELSSLAVKLAATSAVIDEVRGRLGTGAVRLDRIRFGRASLDNLLATARDRELPVPTVQVSIDDLAPRDDR